MPTKRFAWKDRDTAALDLIQLAYHAPLFISRQALHILSAIHSNVIVSDLREITLDSERNYWEQVYALRALAELCQPVNDAHLCFPTGKRLIFRLPVARSPTSNVPS